MKKLYERWGPYSSLDCRDTRKVSLLPLDRPSSVPCGAHKGDTPFMKEVVRFYFHGQTLLYVKETDLG